jgi:hypothetical protein
MRELSPSPASNPALEVQSKLGIMAIVAFVVLVAIGLIAQVGTLLRPLYILGSLGVGLMLYLKHPPLYLGFTWWLWFVTSFVARVIDYQTSFDELRLLQVAPFLVTLLSLHTCIKEMPRSVRYGGFPFILVFTGLGYGFLVGLVQTSPVSAARGLLDWLTPVAWGFYLFTQWRDYPAHRQAIQRTFLGGVLILGSYGIYQYLVAPDWDRIWLISTQLTSMGQPQPLGMRVWSTMASSGPFAMTMMAGLLLLFSSQSALRIPAAVVGYLSFLLSLVRTLWGAWLVGVLLLIVSFKRKLRIRLSITLLVMVLCIVPLATIEPFSGTISTRLSTFSTLSQDSSAKARQSIYEDNLISALSKVLGNGIGNTFVVNKEGKITKIVIDSGILDIFFTLGWVGGAFYLSGMSMLFYQLFQKPKFTTQDALQANLSDSFMPASRAVSLAALSTLPIGSSMLAGDGMILWGFLSIAIAAQKYQQQCVQFPRFQSKSY